jgi:hypothetical protein
MENSILSLPLFLSYLIFLSFSYYEILKKNKIMLEYSGGNECHWARKLVPSAWNIPMLNARNVCRIWTLMGMFPLGIRVSSCKGNR